MANTTNTLALDLSRSHVALIHVVRLSDISYDGNDDTGKREAETVTIMNPRLAILGDDGQTVPVDEVLAIELIQTFDDIRRIWMRLSDDEFHRFLNG